MQSCNEEQKQNSFGSQRNKLYSKNCENDHPCKSATCDGWPHFYRTSRFPWYYTWSQCHNLATSLSLILVTVSHLVPCFLCKFNLPMLANLKLNSFCIILYMDRNPHWLADLPAVHPTPILSPQVWTIHCNSLVATDFCTYISYSLTMTCLPTWPPVCATMICVLIFRWPCILV